nr:hypothetical protein CFP56_24234 [Quercus suber]
MKLYEACHKPVEFSSWKMFVEGRQYHSQVGPVSRCAYGDHAGTRHVVLWREFDGRPAPTVIVQRPRRDWELRLPAERGENVVVIVYGQARRRLDIVDMSRGMFDMGAGQDKIKSAVVVRSDQKVRCSCLHNGA